MKKSLLLLLLLPQALHAQDTTNRVVSFGIFLAPELNGLILEQAGSFPLSTIQQKATPQVGLSAALTMSFKLSEKVSLQSGIGYGRKRYKHNYTGLVFESDIDPVLGIVSESSIYNKVRFHELQIPTLVQFGMHQQRILLSTGLLISFQYGSNNLYSETHYGNGQINTGYIKIDPQMNFAGMFQLLYQYQVTNSKTIGFGPSWKYYLRDYIMPNSNLYTFQLKVVFSYY